MIINLFWFFVLAVLYVYLGYPLLLAMLRKLFACRKDVTKSSDVVPSVSLIIAAYNEEKSIQKKIENGLALDYPADKLEIIVASDGSTDGTNNIVQQFASRGVKLVTYQPNRGKSFAQNEAVKHGKGDIILFSDANCYLRKDALKELIAHFSDGTIGCVVGKVTYLNEGDSSVGEGEGVYWRYELFLRKLESDIGNFAMGSGPIMALRKKLFRTLDKDVGEDFVLPMQICLQGFRVIYEPKAISEEILFQTRSKDMFKTKVRIISKDLRGLFSCAAILNPFRYPLYSLGLISHKLLRWLVPYFLLAILFLNAFLLSEPFYFAFFIVQIVFYFLAWVGSLLENKGISSRLCGIPFAFCVVNLAAFFGVIKFITGQKSGRWEPIR